MPWHDGLDEATLGHAKLNGWLPESNPEEVARAAISAHLAAQKQIGAPADQFIRKPIDANDADGWARLYDATGAAKKPEEYTFADVRFKDGSAFDDTFSERLRATAAKLHLSPAAATELAKDMATWADEAEAADAGSSQVALAAADAQLRQSWGGNHDGFKFDAERAATLVGLTPELMRSVAIAHPGGYAAGMEAFRQMAVRVGEAKLIGSGEAGNAGGTKPLSREEAIARREELKGDKAWVKRFLDPTDPGHKEAQTLMSDLTKTIVNAQFGR